MASKSKGAKASASGENWKEKTKEVAHVFLIEFVLAAILTSGWLYGGYYFCDFIPVPETMELKNIWIYYTRCCILPCIFALFFSIFAVASKRGSTAALNPLGGKDHLILLEKNILSNTVEQILLFFLISAVLITYLSQYEMKLLPLFSSIWVIGRILFNIGYRIGFQYRSLGMLCNLFSTTYFIGVICYFVYSRGFWSGIVVTACGASGNGADGTK